MGFKKIAGTGIVGSTESCDELILPWGFNPVTDPMLSSGNFVIKHDGVGFDRCQKIKFLSEWDACIDNLRFCWKNKDASKNCGVCEKCLQTRMTMLIAGINNPKCFDAPLIKDSFRDITLREPGDREKWTQILESAKETGRGVEFAAEIRRMIGRSRVRFENILPIESGRRKMMKNSYEYMKERVFGRGD